jgi:hypothetical protein
MSFNRRDVLRAGLGVASAALADKLVVSDAGAAQAAAGGKITVPKLPYAYDALEPHIDAQTMQIHHDKHHQAYVDKLNEALAKHPRLQQVRPVALLQDPSKLPEDVRQAIINNAGGHVNHSLFWQMMAPNAGGPPTGDIAKAIDSTFGSFDKFKAAFADAGAKRFGSGWGMARGRQRRQALDHQHGQPGQPNLPRPYAAPRRGRVGTRLLLEVPEQTAGLHHCLVERGELGLRKPALRQGAGLASK